MRRALAANAPVLVLTGLIGFTAYCVYFAHNQQITEKEVRGELMLLQQIGAMALLLLLTPPEQMRNGVIRDIKRDRLKRREFERRQQENESQE